MEARQQLDREGTPAEVFGVFLRLGLTSFGGPIAHLGYYRSALVNRRRWLGEEAYAEIVALCQFLPGPTSSQVAFMLGLMRAGPMGALAAVIAFTAPSAGLMLLLGMTSRAFTGPLTDAIVHGLKIVAVVIVAQAVWGMARTLTPDIRRAFIALASALAVMLMNDVVGQVFALTLGALLGVLICGNNRFRHGDRISIPVSRWMGTACLIAFGTLLVGLPIASHMLGWRELALFDIFYRSGALVFGGGHVVLPLLQTSLVEQGWVNHDQFVAGYGAAQAIPGPLFSVAAYLGSVGDNGLILGLLALLGIFLPGYLILMGVLPFWTAIGESAPLSAAIAGINASVVGILAFALYDPLWTTSVISWRDIVLIAAMLFAVSRWAIPPVITVATVVFTSVVIDMI